LTQWLERRTDDMGRLKLGGGTHVDDGAAGGYDFGKGGGFDALSAHEREATGAVVEIQVHYVFLSGCC
jgi:hypothetical protein